MIMHFYIIEINIFFLEVEALKLFKFLQEDIFHQRNLYANSAANVHLMRSLKYRKSIDEYI